MKILEIGMTDKLGGLEMYFHNYYYKFSNSFHFDFIDMYNGMYFAGEYIKNGSKVIVVPNFKKNPVKCFLKLKKEIKAGNYDLVHINMLSTANIIPVIAAKLAKVKVIIHSHNSDLPKGMARQILHHINKPIINLIANERFACSQLAGEWMFGKRPFKIICNAMDIEKFQFDKKIRSKIRNELKLDDAVVLGHIGRFQEQKNHTYLIDIFDYYHKLNNNSKLLLIGQGNLQSQIKSKIDQLKLTDDVIFVGETNEVEKYYQAMDVFVFPSLFEGLGMVAIEAQASGLPVIASANVPDEIKLTDNVDFIGIGNDNLPEWVNAIEKYISRNFTRRYNFNDCKYDIQYAVRDFERYLSLI